MCEKCSFFLRLLKLTTTKGKSEQSNEWTNDLRERVHNIRRCVVRSMGKLPEQRNEKKPFQSLNIGGVEFSSCSCLLKKMPLKHWNMTIIIIIFQNIQWVYINIDWGLCAPRHFTTTFAHKGENAGNVGSRSATS